MILRGSGADSGPVSYGRRKTVKRKKKEVRVWKFVAKEVRRSGMRFSYVWFEDWQLRCEIWPRALDIGGSLHYHPIYKSTRNFNGF